MAGEGASLISNRKQIFYKNEKNNLSSGAYLLIYFIISKKLLKI
jgi:hypothetical protein